MITVFIVDDHPLVRAGLVALLREQPDMEVVGDAAGGREALLGVERHDPDVALLDVALGKGEVDGIELCRQLGVSQPDTACVMLTSVDDAGAIDAARDAGAAAYVLKSIDTMDLVETIRRVDAGDLSFDAGSAKATEEGAGHGFGRRLDRLTARERQVLDLIGAGLTNRQIADRLDLAERTVEDRVSGVLTKLGLAGRSELAALAARLDERQSRWRSR